MLIFPSQKNPELRWHRKANVHYINIFDLMLSLNSLNEYQALSHYKVTIDVHSTAQSSLIKKKSQSSSPSSPNLDGVHSLGPTELCLRIGPTRPYPRSWLSLQRKLSHQVTADRHT